MESYEQRCGHPAHFVVRYWLYAPDEGGRRITYQHLRCDFLYDGDDPHIHGLHAIHPEFLDERGNPIEEGIPVPLHGLASMFIFIPEQREQTHRSRIRVGTRGYFMEGARKIGEVVVEQIVGFLENPS